MWIHEGSLLFKPVPILTMTSDQGSNLFATYVHLAYTIGLRLVYFADINHIESNVENGIFEVINFGHLIEKSLFLARLHHAPKRSEGRWHSQIKNAFEVGRLESQLARDGWTWGCCGHIILNGFHGHLIPGKSDPGMSDAS